ncbi:PAS/PAC sensor signal transduction histidine kinase [Candidatus Magnetoovum chiemensis]|nr:PAS/PAC sensor signal transduction histidine kinase [Candidatus Magnetoovum chiemensis]
MCILLWHNLFGVNCISILIDNINDAIFIIAPETGCFLDVNKKACENLGYSKEELLTFKVFDIEANIPNTLHWDEHVREVKKNGYALLEGRHKRKDTSILDVEINVKHIRHEDKEYMVAIVRDIRERKTLEKELLKRQETLNEAQRIAHIGNWDWDIVKNEIVWSDEVYRIFGLEANNLGLTYEAFLECVHENDREYVNRSVNEALYEGRRYNIEHRIVLPDKTERVVIERAEVYFGANSTPVRMIGTVQDITEQKNLVETLKKSEAVLEQRVREEIEKRRQQEQMLIQQSKLAAMGEMMSAIAHQWRQPLNTIGLLIQDLEDAYEYGEVNKNYIENLINNSMLQIKHMSKTIDDFKDFFKPSKQKELFDVKLLTGEALSMFTAQLIAHNINYKLTCRSHNKTYTNINDLESCYDMMVSNYKSEFKQVILNLISNAKDAIIHNQRCKSTHKQMDGIIEFIFNAAGDTLTVQIKDNGGGICADIIERIFEPYFTTKFPEQGTGIGLYMSKLIIENNMKGKIYAENIEDGAMFTIKLNKKDA